MLLPETLPLLKDIDDGSFPCPLLSPSLHISFPPSLSSFPLTSFLYPTLSVVLFGIEAHICVLQTALELLAPDWGVKVHVLADGVSSCNPEEVGIALAVSVILFSLWVAIGGGSRCCERRRRREGRRGGTRRRAIVSLSSHFDTPSSSTNLKSTRLRFFVHPQRLRSSGAIITTSESILFQIQHDASTETFRPFSKEVKEVKEGTKDAMKVLGSLASGGGTGGSKL